MTANGKALNAGRTSVVITVVTLVLSVIAANPAAAHYIAREEVTEEYGARCVWQEAEVSHGAHDNGYFKSGVHSKRDVTDAFGIVYNCAGLQEEPAGDLRARANVYTTNATGGNIAFCATTGTWKNRDASYKFHTVMEANSVGPPCGPSYYRTRAGGGVWQWEAWHHHRIWTPKSEPHILT
jgi:hypothetical protein